MTTISMSYRHSNILIWQNNHVSIVFAVSIIKNGIVNEKNSKIHVKTPLYQRGSNSAVYVGICYGSILNSD